MIREEAIEFIAQSVKGDVDMAKVADAIKALDQGLSSSEKPISSDCVDRHSVDLLAYRYLKEPTDNHVAFYEDFLDLPSVTPIRPKGQWKLVQRGKSIDVCCSNCEAVRIEGYAYNYTIDQLDKDNLEECFECASMRYCPNCGAEMDGAEECKD